MSVEQLHYILNDEKLRPVYEEYLKQQMAWENFGFIEKVDLFNRTEQPDKQKEIAQEIYTTFIMPDAEHELGDLDIHSRREVEAGLENPSSQCFEHLVDFASYTLASATVEEFLRDAIYIKHVQAQFPDNCNARGGSQDHGGCFRGSIFSCIDV